MFSVDNTKIRVHSHERRNELKPVWDFISVENLTSVVSQLSTCVHMNWGEMKLKTVWISYRSFWQKWNFISGDKICKHHPKWKAYNIHQNIESFWNVAEMKLHVNKTCFHTGLKSQTGMNSFRLMWTYSKERLFSITLR